MTENGEYCIDILTQISAADSALKSVALLLLDDHLHHCVAKAAAEGGTVADESWRKSAPPSHALPNNRNRSAIKNCRRETCTVGSLKKELRLQVEEVVEADGQTW